MKNAYVIGHITIKNQQKWLDYKNKVPATLSKWGAELVFRGSLSSVLSGNHLHKDTVVIRFSDLNAANNWFNSDEYQSIIPIREAAADVDLLVFEQ